MTIAFFVTSFPNLSETFIANQIIGLQNSGHTVHIYSQRRSKDNKVHEVILQAGFLENTFYISDIPKSRIGKIKSLIFKLMNKSALKNFGKVYRTAFKNKSKLSVYDLIPFLDKPYYDVLHAHFGINGNYVTSLRKLGLFSKAQFITSFHGYDLNQKLRENKFYDVLFSTCNLFTVNTNYSKSLLIKLGCDENKINMLPVGLNSLAFKRTRKPQQETKIQLLFVGRLIKLKGPDLFIKICKKLNERNTVNFQAIIIGEGEMFLELTKMITAYKFDEVVELAGAKTQEEVMQYMNESDIFVLPGIEVNGLAETQGLVIQEAQAMGLPVIVSDAGGMSDGMIDAVTGYVLPQNDIDGFSDKIELLATNYALRNSMGEAGRKLIEENYDMTILNERLLKIYEIK